MQILTSIICGKGNNGEDDEDHSGEHHKEDKKGQVDPEDGLIFKITPVLTEEWNTYAHISNCKREEEVLFRVSINLNHKGYSFSYTYVQAAQPPFL